MTKKKISKYISAIISLLFALSASAQEPTQPQQPQQRTMGVQYQPAIDSVKASLQARPMHFFEGMSVSGDLLGLIMYKAATYGQIEGAFRINLKGRFFPTVELGLGHSDHQDGETDLHFKTNSPYMRIGCDYNLAKDLRSGNRVFVGLRYAYSQIKFDLTGPDLVDPVWQESVPYSFKGLKSDCSWSELVFGLEAKIWGCFHMGWSLRYRMRLSQKESDIGQAWYVPGFGKNDTHNFGGTFNLIFDI